MKGPTVQAMCVPVLLLFVLLPTFAQDKVHAAIERGSTTSSSQLLKEIRKGHSVSIAKYPVALKVTFFTPNDLVALAVSDAGRRHQQISLDAATETLSSGFYRLQLEANSGGAFSLKVRQWEPPDVHMTLTVNGTELQPTTEDLGSVIASSFGNTLDVKTLFTFKVPASVQTMKVTIISAGGSEKSKEVNPQQLFP